MKLQQRGNSQRIENFKIRLNLICKKELIHVVNRNYLLFFASPSSEKLIQNTYNHQSVLITKTLVHY